jgi:hypothetical protein
MKEDGKGTFNIVSDSGVGIPKKKWIVFLIRFSK